jgi:ABC-type polysaccharide/polyol phosphate export permease
MAFYVTPIIYTPTLFPNNFRWVLNINPMTHIINGYRDILYYQQLPNIWILVLVGLSSLFLVFIGYRIFKRLEKGFAEEI